MCENKVARRAERGLERGGQFTPAQKIIFIFNKNYKVLGEIKK